MTTKLIIRNEQDTAWKEILDAYFKDCISYCLPDLSELIDWEKPIVSLDKELQAITKGAKTGKRLLDKLVKLFFKDGKEKLVLLHLEIQGSVEQAFPKRMFIYAYRIWDKYQLPLISCAILTDENANWRPNTFEVAFAGSYLKAGFLVIKLLDYRSQINELENATNPFCSVIIAQLAALDAKSKSDEQRKTIKFMLTKRLYEKGFSKQEIANLYKFIDWCIGLPKEFEVKYLNEVYEFEEARKMPYISNAERFGIEKGIEKGVEKGKLEDAQAMLDEGCEPVFVAKITKLSLEKIKTLQKENAKKGR